MIYGIEGDIEPGKILIQEGLKSGPVIQKNILLCVHFRILPSVLKRSNQNSL